MSVVDGKQRVNTLVLDAGPIITQSASSLLQYAERFFTTPGVFNELKDEHVRNQLILWGDNLVVRQPSPESINFVVRFARLTGDSTVLSQNDLHIIALAYEIECELNNGDWRLRKYPGEKRQVKSVVAAAPTSATEVEPKEAKQPKETKETKETKKITEVKPVKDDGWTVVPAKTTEEPRKPVEPKKQEVITKDIVEETIQVEAGAKKPRRRGGKRHKKKTIDDIDQEENTVDEPETESSPVVEKEVTESIQDDDNELKEEFSEDEDDGEWITEDNLLEEMIKAKSHDIIESTNKDGSIAQTKVKVALTTGDFAVQNVALQIGINLLNSMTGLQIKRVRNYMLRCHACFRLVGIPKDGTPKHFCPSCGGSTLMRCAVSINSQTGKVTPHLKANFEWHTRGDKYSLSSPLSKNWVKKKGNAGFQHSHKSGIQEVFLREDQKEYQQAIKDSKWQARQNEKLLQDWVGGGSAENVISPFVTGNHSDNLKNSGVKVGKSRYVNSVGRRRK